MSRVIVVSPHLDDAVFSAGNILAHETNAKVVTIFAGDIESTGATQYDYAAGFASSAEAMQIRKEEDRRATAALGVQYEHMPFHDVQYGLAQKPTLMKRMLAETLREADVIYGPLGLKHPDHVKARELVINYWLNHREKQLYLYEDLPYRVIEPIDAQNALVALYDAYGIKVEYNTPLPVSQQKVLAVHQYASQMNTGDITPYTVLVPERIWRVTNAN